VKGLETERAQGQEKVEGSETESQEFQNLELERGRVKLVE
jgi:hypothetical protein